MILGCCSVWDADLGGLLMGLGFGAVVIYGTVIWGHYSIWGGDWGVLIT